MKQLRPYQSAALDSVSDHFKSGTKRVILCCPTGGGKCLGFGTPVLMFDGTVKAVQDVSVGDLLMGPDGAPRTVMSVCSGREEMFRVFQASGMTYTVNRSHILSVMNFLGTVKNVTVDEWLASSDEFKMSYLGWKAIPGNRAASRCSISLESIGEGDYYGFEISGPDRLFLLGDFTVTHNTMMGSEAVRRTLEKGHRVLWVAHRGELVDQAAKALYDATGQRVGIVQGSRRADPSARVQVATIQTLIRREDIPKADLVVGDEAHRMLAKQWHALLETYTKSYFLYLTATPERGDGKPMGDLADAIVSTVQPQELIDEGVLVPSEIIAPNAEVAKGLAEDPVSAYMKWGGRRRAVFFCQTKEHARRVTEQLEAQGIPSGMVTDDTPWAIRKSIYKKVNDGTLRALVNVFVATEGLDIPPLEVCVIARTMGHASMYIQAVGRVLRASRGKSSALIIDLKGVVEKYGSPEADRHYHLEGDESVTLDDKGAAKRMKCPQCGSLRSGPVCPVCGLAMGSDRPAVPEIVNMSLSAKNTIDRSDEAAAQYIRIVHDYLDKRVKDFAKQASAAYRKDRGCSPCSEWISLYADFLRGQLPPSKRPAWWPREVESSHYRKLSSLSAAE